MNKINKIIKSSLFLLSLTLFCSRISVCAETPVMKGEVRRLPPSAFTILPPTIRRALETRSCTIPQAYDNGALHNVISGEFIKKGQKDWAVLCSRNGSSSILIFWNESASEITELETSRDDEWFQSFGSGQYGFSREIMVAGKKQIAAYHDYAKEFIDQPDLPPLTHDGIDHFFVNKASSVLYYYKGRWLKLSGAD
jgi:hypothetical protein